MILSEPSEINRKDNLISLAMRYVITACVSLPDCNDCPFYDTGTYFNCLLGIHELGGCPYEWDLDALERRNHDDR